MAACSSCGVHPPAGFSFCPDCVWDMLNTVEQGGRQACSGHCGNCAKTTTSGDGYFDQFEGSGLSPKMIAKGPKKKCCGKCRERKPKTCSRCPTILEAMGHDPEEFRAAVKQRSVYAP